MDARDIAEVAVAALRAPDDHRGRAYTITGREPTSLGAFIDAHLDAWRTPGG
ncbi:hypothetical protein OUY22_06045 [Nonomuraea sp. MCN248]|uniref:Uncharacterized protein n=1 Tax=Nonomuraea corallina TaxID=2989783 RepID=A0ABT4S721_9ACTN|nr:hypothetical protein [Nonomuraea corallina]MDA0632974.1 hypothetical protein [Nonomuraea corallina]